MTQITQMNQGSAAARQATMFTFTDASKTTQIVYYPHVLNELRPPGSSLLEYQGSEGNFASAPELQDSPLGTLITVALKPNVDAGGRILTLVLPPVNLGNQNQQTFETVAIKTTTPGNLIRDGAQLTYKVLNLQGIAQYVLAG